MEQWFNDQIANVQIEFDADMINVKRFIDNQDLSELLVLTEYILSICL